MRAVTYSVVQHASLYLVVGLNSLFGSLSQREFLSTEKNEGWPSNKCFIREIENEVLKEREIRRSWQHRKIYSQVVLHHIREELSEAAAKVLYNEQRLRRPLKIFTRDYMDKLYSWVQLLQDKFKTVEITVKNIVYLETWYNNCRRFHHLLTSHENDRILQGKAKKIVGLFSYLAKALHKKRSICRQLMSSCLFQF
eukprot:Gregarina_sp_Poly_1__1096@NODE_1268_length_4539_cov_74_613819_g863_i0_p3_GENE_NODE_1268_length_4539_cov_74_613819_g863_i0NODE_1268_length_4539_cov_74_613819_g863_i0_p3_ORF_typecomplete_len196_score15_02Poxvirus/PF06227_12/0_013_NODE_1268_length_4539_cov_74_613819_g863_i013111898